MFCPRERYALRGNSPKKDRKTTPLSALSKKEKEYIENWTQTLCMPVEMIKEAYERCIDVKGKLSFAYINGILNDWFKKGWKKVSDIESADKKEPARVGRIKSYDSSAIEEEILKRLAGE